jgi:ubiquinone/menaquinone biosynthesis C-methylase UbiE
MDGASTKRENGASAPSNMSYTEEAERIRQVYAKRGNPAAYSTLDPAQGLMLQEREEKLRSALSRHEVVSLEGKKILEIGCGEGVWLRRWMEWGARPENIVGIDLLADRIAVARQACPPEVALHCREASNLEGLGTFDIVMQSTVFTSILDAGMKRQIASEMLRVLRPQGLIVWYDFHVNNPANVDVRGIRKSEIEELFPGCTIDLQKLTLAPPIGRPLARLSRKLYIVCSAIKPLCSHYLGIIQKA